MGSFQQVVMGGICLVAAFWFGSYINDQPAALQQPLQGSSHINVADGTSYSQVPSQLAAKPGKGLFSSFLEAPAKPNSVTLADLRSRTTSNPNYATAQELRLPERTRETLAEVAPDYVKAPLPNFGGDSAFVPNNTSDQQPLEIVSNHASDQHRLEIVPDFSTLAEDFKREQAALNQRNDSVSETQAVSQQIGSMLPVPKLDDFSRASFGNPMEQPKRDWNAVRQAVTSVEDKLKQFHNNHPVAEQFEPLRSEPLQSAEQRFPVAATTTSGRFIPADRVERLQAQQQEIDRQQVDQLEVSLQEYERQELERQELQRQEFLRRRPGAYPAESSWSNADRSQAPPVPYNELRPENQFTDRGQNRSRRFEPAHRPTPPETFAQRQSRWKVFGDRTGASGSAVDTNPDAVNRAEDYSSQSRFAEPTRPERNSIPEASRVRSLYDLTMDDGARSPERHWPEQRSADHAAYQQDAYADRERFQPSAPRQRVSSVSSANDAGPEVIRYGDFKTYVTERGDTLQTISESFFGTPEYYFDLYLANRNILVNPATVPTGVELRIPRIDE